jgi:hypothetical protein
LRVKETYFFFAVFFFAGFFAAAFFAAGFLTATNYAPPFFTLNK